MGIPDDLHQSALIAIDKLDKIGLEGVLTELSQRGVVPEACKTFGALYGLVTAMPNPIGADASTALLHVQEQFFDSQTIAGARDVAAVENLKAILELTKGTSAGSRVSHDPYLARGLSYYTGAIFEINVPDLAGSLGGGGRYDNLVGMFLGQSVPACGFSLGLERILVVMGERGMFPPTLATTPADVMMAVFDAKDTPHALRVAQALRASGLRVMVYPDADKIGKQIKYADSQRIPYVAILGGDEIANGTVTVKNLMAQTQTTYDQAAAGAAILEGLTHRG
jgi:histidyl-tRNA synthetase